MTRSARLFVLAIIALCGCFAAARAAAYWPESGTGSGAADVGTLLPPANVVATATIGSATVSVNWGAVLAPDTGDITGYYVQRFAGSTPSAACATSAAALLPAAVTNCSDADLADGTYTYVVTAVYHSWSAVSAASSAVTVTSAFHFELTTPASVTSNVPFTMTVTARDNQNNIVAGYVGTVHFASTDPAAPTLPADFTFTFGDSGTHTFVNGLTLQTAPSQNVSVTEVGDPTHNGVRSVLVTAGAATQLVITNQPSSGTGGIALAAQPKVTVQDALGNTVTTSNAAVTLAITSGTGTSGAVLNCTTNPLTVVSGVATFAGCKVALPGTGYTLTATASGLTSAVTNPFNITVGPASQVVYTQQPTTAVAGVAISPALTVVVQDAGGNTVTTSSATVTIAIGTNPGGGTLSGTVSVSASAGIATFNGLSINKVGTGYTLITASTGLTSATSSTFNITVAAAAKLAVTQQTIGGTGGVAWTTQPKVTIQDAFGNTITTSTASVTLAITSGTGTSGAVLTCTTNPIAAVSGVATFAGCKIDKAGTNYTLTATATGLTSTITNAFNVTVGPATKVVYTQQPTTAVAGVAISPAVTVAVQDAGGNTVTTSSATVTIAIGTNPGGGTLSGTVSVSVSAGVATFNNLSINKTGTGYTLVSASTGLTSATSSAFNITFAAAAKLAVTQQTTGGTGGVTWATQPRVTIQDAFGNTITTSTASVTLAITSGTGASGAVLTCTANPKAAASGVATFAGCKINKAGTSYTLTATATGLTSAIGNPFNITIGPATKVVYTQQPTTAVAGVAVSPSVTVTVQDAGGNTVNTSSATVTIAISTNPGGGTLSGTNPIASVSGIATFAGCKIDKAGTNYTLTATATGLTNATSNAFNITVGAATKVAYTQQPSSSGGGTAISPAVTVAVQDAGGNTVTTSIATVTIAIGTNPAAGTLSGTVSVSASAGIATFSNLSINKAGTGYTLTTASTGLTSATSSTFNIVVGAASKVVYTQQPTAAVAGVSISPAITVTVQDAGGNPVTTSTATVTMTIGTNPGSGTLSGTVSVNAVAGVATFNNLSINKTGTGYTLVAASTGLTSATSSAFNITFAAAAQLGVAQQTTGGTGGVAWSTQPTIAIQDAFGNTVTTSTASVTVTITAGTGTSGAVLTCTTNPRTAVAGIATMAGCKIDKAGTGYTLTATATGLTSTVSSAFDVTVGPATKVVYTQQPTTAVAGVSIAPAITLTVQDAGSNVVTSSAATVTMTIGTNPGAGTLSGTVSVNAVAGIATFNNLSINKTGTGYTLIAASTGLTSATSSAFNITFAAAAQLGFVQQTTGGAAGVVWTTQPTIAIQDAFGNTVTTSVAAVTLTITSGTGTSGAVLTCTTNPRTAVAGIATMAGCKIDKPGAGYSLTATGTGLTSTVSSTFTIS